MISVVVPVFNEEKNIQIFIDKIIPIILDIDDYEIIFCLDPSSDNTEEIIKKNAISNTRIKLIKFSRRFKQSNAILAGIENCSGEHCVIIDVDLQDPPELIKEMHKKINQGYDCVYAKRIKKVGENILRVFIIKIYYLLINKFSEVEIPTNVGEFRIISRRMIELIKKHGNYNFYLRGITSLIGFKSTNVEFVRKSRELGNSKYLIGSYKDALNGVLNFTSVAQNFSILIFFINIILGIFLFIFNKIDLSEFYFSQLISLLFLFIYFIISYLMQINNVIHNKPSYIVEEKINFK